MSATLVPLQALCENCGHFAGSHQGLRCHFPPSGPRHQYCACTGMTFQGRVFEMDMDTGPVREVKGSPDAGKR